MASYHVPPLEKLVEQFQRLPGIGHKSAQRLAYHVLGMTDEQAKVFSDAILDAHSQIHYCRVCCNLTDQELCPVCRSESRDRSVICVVEDPKDWNALMSIMGCITCCTEPFRRFLAWDPNSCVLKSCWPG